MINYDIQLKYEPREAQNTMVKFVDENVGNGVKFSLIDSPVGTGKSYGAVMVADMYRKKYNQAAHFDVITNSKILQEQYTSDFSFMQSLWGKENYRCENFDCGCGTGKPLAKAMKMQCENCPLDIAREHFFAGLVSITNFHLYITYHVNIPRAWTSKRSARVLIIDEAHEFDAVFCDFITSKMSKFALKRCGLSEPECVKIAARFGKVQNIQAYADVVQTELLPRLAQQAKQLARDRQSADETEQKKILAHLEGITNQVTRWETFLVKYEMDPDNWVLEQGKDNRGNPESSVQPVWAGPYLNEYVWSHYDHVILMSGTILDKNLFCFMNGLAAEETNYICIPSPFPAANRPIYYLSLGKMNYANKDATYENQQPFINRILGKYSDKKGIIHTFSYENMNRVVNGIPNQRLLHHESATRNAVLERHIATAEPTVLVSPSMMTGIDLKEDLSRFQIIMKIPYPNLSSEKIKRRMATNSTWYSWATVCSMLQMYGRSIRSETDTADTFILDSCFSDILKYSGKLIPGYVKEAIIHVNV